MAEASQTTVRSFIVLDQRRWPRIAWLAVLLTAVICSASAKKPRPGFCAELVCVQNLHWEHFDDKIHGDFVNLTDEATVELGSLTFALKYGDGVIGGSALTVFPTTIPPHGKLTFTANPSQIGGEFYTDSADLLLTMSANGKRASAKQTFSFDRMWSPYSFWQRRAWEKSQKKANP
ncbi:MAG: hypothetical protein WBE37_25860 [Bryobacteraceae bacterium]